MTSIVSARRPVRIVAIGASVGGPPALNTVLRALPADFPLPILCVQHIGPGFVRGLVEWLGSDCKLKVKVAEQGELPRAGTVYFPPESLHLLLDGHGRLITSAQAPVSGHRPSVTVTFNSVAAFYGKAAAGILLTGMGEDGAEGLKTIAEAGGLTIAQDEKTSVVFGMPGHAVALGAARFVLPIGKIGENLLNHVMQRQEQL
jgi:two-component system, chemotaxis family, protein-glutamate methylesterase/glutaminase